MKAYMYNHLKITNWPPATGGSYGPGDVFPMPGDGTLHDAKLVPAFRHYPAHLSVEVEFQGRISSGPVLAVDANDRAALPALLNELKKLIGRDLRDISNMELDL